MPAMKAMMLWRLNDDLQLEAWDWGTDLKENEVEVDLFASSLNHRDIWITKGLYPNVVFPSILGSDGSGVLNNENVVIYPALNWGGDERVQSAAFQVLGMPTHGTFAEKIRIPKDCIHPMPNHLSYVEAAALPLAGLTAYRALFSRAQISKSDRVLIHGVGGGVATLAFQFALALGCSVWVTSGSNWKIEKALQIGATGAVNYKDEDWHNQLKKLNSHGFDIIIDSAGGGGFKNLVKIASPGGTICFYGGTQGKYNDLAPQPIFWKQLNLLGSTMGSPTDFKNMLSFVAKYKVKPIIDQVFSLTEMNAAVERLSKSEQFGKIVINNKD
jgi:zinc-binding alcohol dehydrogenase/oxidoreductase